MVANLGKEGRKLQITLEDPNIKSSINVVVNSTLGVNTDFQNKRYMGVNDFTRVN